MATSNALKRALAYRKEQEKISVEASDVVARMLIGKLPWATVLGRLAQYQLLAAEVAVETMATWAGRSDPNVDPRPFAGVSSYGFAIAEPLVATIDARVPAPAQAIPAPWWHDAGAFVAQVRQLVDAEVLDAARSAAGAEMVTEHDWQNYVRVLTPPSCKRCVVLAGKIYRDLDGFKRHPGCDCVHYPVQDWEEAHGLGLVSSPEEAYEKGLIRDLTAGERRAIDDGADITTVVNSSSGIYTADRLGKPAKATRYGTSERALWRMQHPSTLVRLRPEAIYKIVDQQHGGDRDIALRMLNHNGYLTEVGQKILKADGAGGSGGSGRDGSIKVTAAGGDDEAARTARDLVTKAANAEPDITAHLREVEKATRSTIRRLSSKLKTVDSLARKLRTLSAFQPMPDAAAGMKDVLRYTLEARFEEYWGTVDQVASHFDGLGYRVVKKPAGWLRDGYRGMNLAFTSPDGQTFEVQVHTVESLLAAETCHGWYEEQRLDTTPLERKRELEKLIEHVYAGVRMPNPPRWA